MFRRGGARSERDLNCQSAAASEGSSAVSQNERMLSAASTEISPSSCHDVADRVH